MVPKKIPRQDSAEGSTLAENTYPKIQAALSRVNSLTDKLSQTQYPSQYIDLCSKPMLAMDKKTFILTAISLLFLFIALHSRLRDNGFILYRVFCNLLGLSFFLLSSQVFKSMNQQLSIFYSIRILGSSVIYSYVSNRSLSYEFHIQSHEYDIIIEILYAVLVSICFQKEASAIKYYVTIGFIVDVFLIGYLQVISNHFDFSPYFVQGSFGIFIYVFYFILAMKGDQQKAIMESSVIEHCKEISKELKEIHHDLKEEENYLLQLRTPTSSVADEIITKIKYFKFKMLQEEKEKMFLNTKNSVLRPTKMTRGISSLGLSKKQEEEKSLASQAQRRMSHVGQERNQEESEVQLETVKERDEPNYTKWKISAKDCDILIKMMLEKQAYMYYPNVLKEADNNEINHETAEFLKQHFTEIGNALLSPGVDRKNKHFSLQEPQDFTYSPWNEYLEANICSWNFDMLKFKDLTNGRHFLEFGNAVMKRFNVLKTLDTSPNIATNFLKDVAEGYIPNPYHNSIHGADVANAAGYFLSNEKFGSNFTELEASCLILSALVHDVGHPGFNNAFLIATKSTEALLYNDQSVLENLHSAYFFKILQKPTSNILHNLNEKDYKYFRKLSIALILDTDLTKHFVILTKFKGIVDQPSLDEESKLLSLSIALKCADVGHGAKELSLHKKWSRRIIEEFYLQGDKEREHGIPISPLCERSGKVSNSQQGFINFVCLPLLEAFDKKFFNEKMRLEVTDQVKQNLQYWVDEIPKEEKGESKFMEETSKILDDIKGELPTPNEM